jgi:hypothetical protein
MSRSACCADTGHRWSFLLGRKRAHIQDQGDTPAMYIDLSVVRGAGVVLLVVAVAAAILWKVLVERWRSGL